MKIFWSEFAIIILKDITNYYKEVAEGILITDIFDIRQDSIKINNPERKKRE